MASILPFEEKKVDIKWSTIVYKGKKEGCKVLGNLS